MRLLAKRNVNPSEGIKPSESPNVGQYGWTSFEAHQYNQLIEYVDIAKSSVETCIEAATYVTRVMEQDVNPSFEKMGHLARNMEAMYLEFGKDYVAFSKNYENFTVKYNNFTNLISDFDTDYSDFSTKYPDFVTKYNDVVVKHGEVAANTKRVEDLYNELKDGQVYRGVWNPSSGAYPNPEGTNSSWDVVLDEGKVTDTFDGKTWQNGHKLVWVVTDNAFTQIATAAGVTSVNGKFGAVTLTAQDVHALPLTGGTLIGDLAVNTKIVAKNVGNPSEELILSAKDGVVKVGTNFVYHEGYKPSTAQLGAVPNTRLINNKQLNADVTLTAADVGALPSVGDGSVNGNVNIIGNLSERGSRVYTSGNKPTPGDIGALSSTGGTLTGHLFMERDSDIFLRGAGTNNPILYFQDSDNNNANKVAIYHERSLDNLVLRTYGATSEETSRIFFKGADLTASFRDQNGLNSKFYHENFKPTAADVGALSLSGGTINGILDLTGGRINLKGNRFTALAMSNDFTGANHRNKFIEYADNGDLLIITRGDDGLNRGIITIPKDLDGTVYTSGNPPTARDVELINPRTKEVSSLYDVINEMRAEIEALKAVLLNKE